MLYACYSKKKLYIIAKKSLKTDEKRRLYSFSDASKMRLFLEGN